MKGKSLSAEPSLMWLIGKKEWVVLTERLDNLKGEERRTDRKAAANMLTFALAFGAPFMVIGKLCDLNQTVLLDATKLFQIARCHNADYRTLIVMQTVRQCALLRRYQQEQQQPEKGDPSFNESLEARSPPPKIKTKDFDFDHTANFFRRPNRPVECECCKATFLPARTVAKSTI